MGETWWSCAQRLVELNMPCCIRQMVLAPDNMGNFHFDVVDNVYEMKDPRTVRASNSHVWLHAAIKLDPTTNDVVHDYRLPRRAETYSSVILVNDALLLQPIQIRLIDLV